MDNSFFDPPILHSSYVWSGRHWQLDRDGQPTQRIIDERRQAKVVMLILKPRKTTGKAEQQELALPDPAGVSDDNQLYELMGIINRLRCPPERTQTGCGEP